MEKIRREDEKNLKIFRGVFDRRTLLVLYDMLNRKILKEIIGVVKEGKESVVLYGIGSEERDVAIKIYRTDACDFKTMWRYLVGDPRFTRVRKNRRFIVNLWCQREFKNLKIAYNAGVKCPRPLAFKENILIMEFLGDNGVPAPRLIDVKLRNPEKTYKQILEDMEKLTKAGLVHGDLSAYNILFLDKPYMIDLSHSISVNSAIAIDLLTRDIENINSHFSKLGIHVKSFNSIYEKLKNIIEKSR